MDTGLRARRHLLELGRGAIAEGRMAADSIIEHLDPFKHILRSVLSCSIAPMMHEFRFQRVEETFHHGIAPAVRAPTHARRQTVTGQQLAVRGDGVLGPTVRMMQQAARRPSAFHGHGERPGHQLLG